MKVKVKYFDEACKIEKIVQGDWIDLRCEKNIGYGKGQHLLVPLGIAMEIPEGYEAHLAPRGSTFKNFGFLQTNSVGIIDNSYCGDNDKWFMSVFCTRPGMISKGDRVCQFRIIEKMDELEIEEVEVLGNEDRGGHGSTGVK